MSATSAKPKGILERAAVALFGTANDRRLKRYAPVVAKIAGLAPEMEALSDEDLAAKTAGFRMRLAAGEALRDLVPEAIAAAREAGRRTLGERAYDVQVTGALALLDGCIAQMNTGEGKTLAAMLAAYAASLDGEGVHVVTVNDYLARRDAERMSRPLNALGASVGVIVQDMPESARRQAYACDVTYGTNSQFGFDHLKDDMRTNPRDLVQRGKNLAIVDEADSILIDEARTPLVISGPLQDRGTLYGAMDAIARQLAPGEDYEVDEKTRSAHMTEAGNDRADALLREAGVLADGDLYDARNAEVVHHLHQAIRAHGVQLRDRDYVVEGDEIVLIDQMTGRKATGRRLQNGLHQAIEAKEGVTVRPESATLASITYQNYFRLYRTLSGMTGTAEGEADEIFRTYKAEVIAIPPNLPVARLDEPDEIYRTRAEKMAAIAAEVEAAHARLQPVLIGTNSVEQSDAIARLLEGIGFAQRDAGDAAGAEALAKAALEDRPTRGFTVLNAKFHEQEAQVVAQAGVPGAVTIATNMAGRGTDIKLGGSAEARIAALPDGPGRPAAAAAILAETERLRDLALASGEPGFPGGLYVIGTERNESRRIDDQLRGRSGRQGDPGRSKFLLSTEDDLMRIFGGEALAGMLEKLGVAEGSSISHPWVDKAIGKAQAKVEQANAEMRKITLDYDDVLNDQRKAVFKQRREILMAEHVREMVAEMIAEEAAALVSAHVPEGAYPEQWDAAGLAAGVARSFALDLPIAAWAAEEGIADQEIRQRIEDAATAARAALRERNTQGASDYAERIVVLNRFDETWREHVTALDHLRQSIGLRSLGQRDPLMEYRQEAFAMFGELASRLRERVLADAFRIEVEFNAEAAEAA